MTSGKVQDHGARGHSRERVCLKTASSDPKIFELDCSATVAKLRSCREQ